MIATRSRIGLISAVVTASVAIVTSPASASPQYPEELREALGLSYTPGCTLCHSTVSGSNVGPVDTPFGKSMVARGLRGATASDGGVDADGGAIDPTLLAALAAMRRDGVNSDGDGAEDLDELEWGTDPNHYDGLNPNSTPSVHYGCQMVRIYPSQHSYIIAAFFGLAIAVLRRKKGSIESRRRVGWFG